MRSARPGLATTLAAAAAAAATALALAGCGSSRASAGQAAPPGGIAPVPLATALTSSGGTSWAVLRLGRSSADFEDFWQLFVRPAGTKLWRLATPAGVASNGGLVAAATGPAALITAFRPTQDLTFSPLSSTADAGAHWSQGSLISPGLASAPDALAAGPGGRLLAVTDRGQAELGTPLGTRWTALTSEQALARTTAGRACSLAGLTAAGWARRRPAAGRRVRPAGRGGHLRGQRRRLARGRARPAARATARPGPGSRPGRFRHPDHGSARTRPRYRRPLPRRLVG